MARARRNRGEQSVSSIGRTSDRSARPMERVRDRKDSKRDEMLSEYLASLGRIPLLSPDEEQEHARVLRETEIACWERVLRVLPCVEYAARHPHLDAAPLATKEALARILRRAARAQLGKAQQADIAAVAEALRELDDERRLIDEVIGVLETCARAQAERALLAEVTALRRRALSVRNHFVRANLRLVVSVARRFHHYRLPLIDLIQEGNLGLIKSVHRFDHRKGFRFSTYAHWWIRQAIERAIMNKGAQVRLPVHVFDQRREVAKAQRELSQTLGREPTVDELAQGLSMPRERLEEVLRAVPREPVSLHDPVGDDEDRTLGETIADKDDVTPDERVIRASEARLVRKVLDRLSPMEEDIIRRRFGLGHDADETLEEIGKSYNLSRERVRQIQVQGLRKMARYYEERVGVA